MVRLKVPPFFLYSSYDSFQFQYGTIESTTPASSLSSPRRFNSSMVRLKVKVRSGNDFVFLVSIPVWYDWKFPKWQSGIISYVFQFQYGTIESFGWSPARTWWSRFNSSMVRLKDNDAGTALTAITLFQFQYGTIERAGCCLGEGGICCFNSSMVRLKDLYP